jgi:hypothetical protein
MVCFCMSGSFRLIAGVEGTSCLTSLQPIGARSRVSGRRGEVDFQRRHPRHVAGRIRRQQAVVVGLKPCHDTVPQGLGDLEFLRAASMPGLRPARATARACRSTSIPSDAVRGRTSCLRTATSATQIAPWPKSRRAGTSPYQRARRGSRGGVRACGRAQIRRAGSRLVETVLLRRGQGRCGEPSSDMVQPASRCPPSSANGVTPRIDEPSPQTRPRLDGCHEQIVVSTTQPRRPALC